MSLRHTLPVVLAWLVGCHLDGIRPGKPLGTLTPDEVCQLENAAAEESRALSFEERCYGFAQSNAGLQT